MDLLPNDGSFYIAPIDQKQKELADKERAKALKALPMIEEVIKWFDKQADEVGRNSVIDLKHPNLSAEQQILAYQKLEQLLRLKKGELATYISAYDKTRK